MKSIPVAVYVSVSNRFAELRSLQRERGLTTTEVAVLTFILVAIAVVIGGLLLTKSKEAVEAIDTTPPEFGGGDDAAG